MLHARLARRQFLAGASASFGLAEIDYADHIRHRTGHGMGLLGHEFPEDVAFNHASCAPTRSIRPSRYVYGLGGFRFDDTVVVGERPELVTKVAQGPGQPDGRLTP